MRETAEPEATGIPAPPTMPPIASPESLVAASGAPSTVYFLSDGAIEVIDTARPGTASRIAPEPGRVFLAVASSPDGERVAVLTGPAGENGAPAAAQVLDRDGVEHGHWPNLGPVPARAATPVAAGASTTHAGGSLSWSAGGDRLLVTLGGTSLIDIDLARGAKVLSVPSRARGIETAAWSPVGDRIAVLTRDANDKGVVWVFKPRIDGDSFRQVVPPNTDAADLGSVTRFAWLPDGSGLAYILASEVEPGVPGGQLYTVDLETGTRALAATSGRVGPAAVIVDFAVSPDGGSIAYAVAMPAGDGWEFDSLWIRALQAVGVYRVPVGDAEWVRHVWWTAPGIAWAQEQGAVIEVVLKAPGAGNRSLLVVGPPGVATPVGATPGATPLPGTPQASPVPATPIPVTLFAATPGATPVAATPMATPEATTPAS